MNLNKLAAFATLALTLAGFSPALFALASDKSQPIYISSDRAERNEKLGVTTYTGSVEMNQGTLQIHADKVVIHSINNEITRIIATGSPAEYQQKPAEDKQLVIARGNKIEYLLDTEKLHLTGNASLRQGDGTMLTGKLINYDTKESVVRAEGNTNSSAPERIHMVIPPKAKADPQNSSSSSSPSK